MHNIKDWTLNLALFAEGGAADGEESSGTATAESAGVLSAVGNGETTLDDGTRVDRRLAERIERLEKKTGRKIVKASPTGDAQTNTPVMDQQQTAAKDPDAEFDELIKGKFAKQYQAKFKAGMDERFKNQKDSTDQLNKLTPMLNALTKKFGIQDGDYEALSNQILDDDSLYEEEAEEHGMTVEAYKSFKKLEDEAKAARAQREQEQQNLLYRNHLQKLAEDGEKLKQTFPDFDLMKELDNPVFRRMTAPNSGISVEQAFFAVHHRELAPAAYGAGMQRARNQISQTIQANAARPVEGALSGSSAPVNPSMDPRKMTKEQREDIRNRVRRGEKISF